MLTVKPQAMDDDSECVKVIEEYTRPTFNQIMTIIRKWDKARHA